MVICCPQICPVCGHAISYDTCLAAIPRCGARVRPLSPTLYRGLSWRVSILHAVCMSPHIATISISPSLLEGITEQYSIPYPNDTLISELGQSTQRAVHFACQAPLVHNSTSQPKLEARIDAGTSTQRCPHRSINFKPSRLETVEAMWGVSSHGDAYLC